MKKEFTKQELIHSGIKQIRKYLKSAYIVTDEIRFFKERALDVAVTMRNLEIIGKDEAKIFYLIIHREFAKVKESGCQL